jgi:hypothetical protein
MNDGDAAITHPVLKLVTAWLAISITSWADVASILAALYTLLLIGEWLWKRLVRPRLEGRGLVKRKRRRLTDYE